MKKLGMALAAVCLAALTTLARAEDRYVLIDGYARLAALERLGHDVVEVLVLGMEEAPALIFAHRLASPRAGSD